MKVHEVNAIHKYEYCVFRTLMTEPLSANCQFSLLAQHNWLIIDFIYIETIYIIDLHMKQKQNHILPPADFSYSFIFEYV